MITSIDADFLSRLFSSPSKIIKQLSKWKIQRRLAEKLSWKEDWLENSAGKKPR